MTHNQRRQSNSPEARSRGARRGTIIVLALAVLAVLALAGVAYVTVVRLERSNAVIQAEGADRSNQARDIVNNHIAELIAADLFGNKVTTLSVPSNARPKAFEDGETWDAPGIDSSWAEDPVDDTLTIGANDAANDRIARPDDAWLASTEPTWADPLLGNLDTQTREWEFITNLNSAYRWDRERREWRRSEGRFVDLGQIFLNPRDGRADPGVDLDEVSGMSPEDGWRQGWAGAPGPGNGTFANGLFNLQMDELSEELYGRGGSDEFTPLDEREWVDTDGDLRPDARWQQLDRLNVDGLNWFVAARIVDASAFVNANTAIEFPHLQLNGAIVPTGFGDNWAGWHVGTGESPADVDLVRLLSYDHARNTAGGQLAAATIDPPSTNIPNNAFSGPIDVTFVANPPNLGTETSFPIQNHLEIATGFDEAIRILRNPSFGPSDPDLGDTSTQTPLAIRHEYELDTPESGTPRWTADPFGRITPTTRQQRLSYYERAASTRPDTPPGNLSEGYPLLDLVDLFAFRGTNDERNISRLEQVTDGPPQAQRLYPGTPARLGDPLGPLRSGEDPILVRSFDTNTPTPTTLFHDVRRQLTVVSGEADIAPIPVISDAPEFVGINQRRRIRFQDVAEDANAELAQRAFEAFMWALAPFSVEKLDRRDLGGSGEFGRFDSIPGGDPANAMYGGGTIRSAAQRFADNLRSGDTIPGEINAASQLPNGDQLNAAYAFHRALALTANLFDANDDPVSDRADRPGLTDDDPTIIRFFSVPSVETVNRYYASEFSAFTIGGEPITVENLPGFAIDERLAFGSIASDAIDDDPFGPFGEGDDPGPSQLFPDPSPANRWFAGTNEFGVSAIGLERQPFLAELNTFALYQANTPALGGVVSTADADDPLIGDDDDPVTINTARIRPGEPEDQVGSIIAVELRNPWPEDLNVADYIVRLQHDDANFIHMNLGEVADGTTVIAAGESKVFYWASHPAQGSARDELDEVWRNAIDTWEAQFPVNSTARLVNSPVNLGALEESEFGVGAFDPQDFRVVFQPIQDCSIAVLLARDLDGDSATRYDRVLVDRMTDDENRPGGPVNDRFPGALDNETIRGPSAWRSWAELGFFDFDGCRDRIRTIVEDDPDIDFIPGQDLDARGNFRVAVHGKIARPSEEAPSGEGFPQYTIEFPFKNNWLRVDPESLGVDVSARPGPDFESEGDIRDTFVQAWDWAAYCREIPGVFVSEDVMRIDIGPTVFTEGEPYDGTGLITGASGTTFESPNTLFQNNKAEFPLTTAEIPLFQLYVPNRPLASSADVLLLSAYAHIHVHSADRQPPTDPDTGNPIPGSIPKGLGYSLDNAHVTTGPNAVGPGSWLTVSQQLGFLSNRFSDHETDPIVNPGGTAVVQSQPNPYFGRLNPIRYMNSPGNSTGTTPIPSPTPYDFTLPPAIKIPDSFEALNFEGDRAGGRINLNTMTRRVADLLPFLHPLRAVQELDGTYTLNPASNPDGNLNKLLIAWRDREFYNRGSLSLDFTTGLNAFASATGIDGLRSSQFASDGPGEEPKVILSKGELALMGVFDESAGAAALSPLNAQGPEPITMLGFAADGTNIQSIPFDLYADNNLPQLNPDGTPIVDGSQYSAYAEPTYNPTDDAEERLTILRALSNIVSTRSDVFIATYVVRAYRPEEIIQITIPGGTGNQGNLSAMDNTDTPFQPVFNERWLVVFDRSNVRKPTDRPEILLQQRLPATSP